MENNVNKSDVLTDLDHAQRILSRVYAYARDIQDGDLENLMSVADSCIVNAMEALDSEV